jgi:hypothetical protein
MCGLGDGSWEGRIKEGKEEEEEKEKEKEEGDREDHFKGKHFG